MLSTKWIGWVFVVGLLATAASALAQPGRGGPPGGPFGGPGGGSPWDRGPSSRGGFNPVDMLRSRDTNNNGLLEPDEISDRARFFVNRLAEQAGLDPNKPIPLDRLAGGNDDRSRDDDRQRRESSSQSSETPTLVPGFEPDVEVTLVPGFNLSHDSPLLATGPLEKRYDAEILERVERTLRYYDRNRDDILDQEEISRGRWDPDPRDSDLNGDGKLNKVELAERYVKRNASRSSSSSSNTSNSSSSRGPSSFGSPPGSSSSRGFSSSRSGSGGDSRSSSDNSSRQEQYQRYGTSLVNQYDTNRNGVLEKDEWSKMRDGYWGADRNNDSKITADELADHLYAYTQRRNGGSSSSRSGGTADGQSGYRFKTTEERLTNMDLPKLEDFLRDDRNGDGQIQMSEFATTWTDV